MGLDAESSADGLFKGNVLTSLVVTGVKESWRTNNPQTGMEENEGKMYKQKNNAAERREKEKRAKM